MTGEVVILTSGKDGSGMGILDVSTCSQSFASFKNCIADPGCVCKVWYGPSAYSGDGSSGDYIAVAQSKKPVINIYQWGKPQVHQQCHTQEIMTSMTSSLSFLIGGTKRGWIYIWDLSTGELLNSFPAHFKSVSRMTMTKDAQFLMSVSDDGMGKVWDASKLFDSMEYNRSVAKSGNSAYRSWSPHTLPIKDMHVLESLGSTIRVVTCSLDKTIVMYDVHAGRQCLRLSMSDPLESIVCNPGEDFIIAGSTDGRIFQVDLSVASLSMDAALSTTTALGSGRNVAIGGLRNNNKPNSSSKIAADNSAGGGVTLLEGHTKAVTSVACSMDNSTLISTSDDGSMRTWNLWTRQCLHHSMPMNKNGISNAMIVSFPELMSQSSGSKPSLSLIQHLKKYSENSAAGGGGDKQHLPSHRKEAATLTGVYSTTDASRSGGSQLLLGPVFMGFQGTAKSNFTSSQTGNFSAIRREAAAAQSATGLISGKEADFVSFDTALNAKAEGFEGECAIAKILNLQRELASARLTVEQLSADNMQLRGMCAQLQNNREQLECVPAEHPLPKERLLQRHVHMNSTSINGTDSTLSLYTDSNDIGDANELVAAAAMAVAQLLKTQEPNMSGDISANNSNFVTESEQELGLSSVAEQLENARTVIAKLYEDNNEWKRICSRMKNHLKQALSTSPVTEECNETTEDSSSTTNATTPLKGNSERHVQLKIHTDIVELPSSRRGDEIGDIADLSSAAYEAVSALQHHTESQHALASQELDEARKVIAKLHEDNNEWKHICARMKAHIEEVVTTSIQSHDKKRGRLEALDAVADVAQDQPLKQNRPGNKSAIKSKR